MTRSFKKNPVIGHTTAETEKKFKQQEHQRERKRVNDALKVDPEKEVLPAPKEFGNPWAGPKDGKHYLGGHDYEERAKRK